MASTRRVVITGLGLVNPLGLDVASFWTNLTEGRSGVRPLQSFDASALPVRFGGEVLDFDPRNYLDKKDRRRLNVMARSMQFAVAAAHLSVDDAQLDKEKIDPLRFGVCFGSGVICAPIEELGIAAQQSVNGQPNAVDLEKWGQQGLPNVPPMWLLTSIPNMMACHVSIVHNAQGPNNTITQSDVAGLLAMGEGFRNLSRNEADLMLVGGADSRVIFINVFRHCLFSPLSHRNEEPERASRPFDRQRDGTVLSEGGGVLLLEELEHARQRGAKIYAEIAGFGAAFDRARDGKGIARAIRAALRDAGIGPEDVDHINAHGSSTLETDAWESRGIAEVFAAVPVPPPVFAPKSYFGNLGAAASTTELIASLLAQQNQVVPRTLNYEEPDSNCPIPVLQTAREVRKPFVLKLSLTELGQCAALVCRAWAE